MVRAGVVKHPTEWLHSGYVEIQQPPARYRVIDLAALSELCGFNDVRAFQKAHRESVEAALRAERLVQDSRWSESIAVGSEAFVEQVKVALGYKGHHRQVTKTDGVHTLREPVQAYGHNFDRGNMALRVDNTVPWTNNA
jgi:putative transposase